MNINRLSEGLPGRLNTPTFADLHASASCMAEGKAEVGEV